MKPVLRLVDAFPLDHTRPMGMKSLIAKIKENNRCFIFPEGRLTVTGGLMKIYEGPGLIADKTDADIIPVRIDGAQYTPFSRLKNKVRTRWFPKITIRILPARQIKVDAQYKGRIRRSMVSDQLYEIMTNLIFESSPYRQTLFSALLQAKKNYGRKHIILEDIKRQPFHYQKFIQRVFILGQYIADNQHQDKTIGLLLPNSIATVVCFFACHCYGKIPALLNFSTGSQNIKHACQTAKINTVYTSRLFIEKASLETVIKLLQENHITIIYLEDLKQKISLRYKLFGTVKSYFAKPIIASKPDDTAVILFTSGSEGTPKGVALSHQNILANCYQLSARVDFTSKDIILNVLPVFHAFGLTAGTILPLISGIKTFLYPSPLHYRIVPEIAYDCNATIFFGTDTFLKHYAKYAHPYDFYSLRYVFAGAEKLKKQTVELWSEKFGLRILEGYGATEASPVISANTPMHHQTGSVGKLLPHIQYKLEPVPGVKNGGRLFICGPNIMQGYLLLDKPGEISQLAEQWYDTGDIVNIDAQGYIHILDRAKRFAKIAGEMISLTAIESIIYQLWSDKLHAVVTIPDTKKGEAIVLVTEQQDADRSKILEAFKQQQTTELALPKYIFPIKHMFLLGTGKVDLTAVKNYVKKLL